MLDVLASSRASSLPQVQWAVRKICELLKLLWELACQRRRCVRRGRCWMCRPLRWQARSYSDLGCRQILHTAAILCRSCRVQRGCDLLIFKSKVKRSQPAAAPTKNVHQPRRAMAPMAMNRAAIARASWSSPRATSSGICANGTRRHSRGSGSSPTNWQGLSCSASTTR